MFAIPAPILILKSRDIKRAQSLRLAPGTLTTQERDNSAHLIWNTNDDFESDIEIQHYHREIALLHKAGHWYLPFHPTLRLAMFQHERMAYDAAHGIETSQTDHWALNSPAAKGR